MNQDPDSEIQEAFDEADSDAETRAPWTIARHSAAMNLGCKAVLAVGPDVRQLMIKGTYPNALRDVIIVLWLCSLSEKEVIKLNCLMMPEAEEKAIARAFEWAEKAGLEYGNKLFLEGLEFLDRIVSQVWKSFYQTTDNGNKISKKNSGPHGKFDSLIPLSSQPDTMPIT